MPNAAPSLPRRTAPMVLLAAGLALAELALFFHRPVTAWQPPSLYALLAGLAAFFTGTAAIYRLRRQPAALLHRTIVVLATVCGLAATFIFGGQSLHWRLAVQRQEVRNVQTIATACLANAVAHNGQFPPSLDPLLTAGQIPPATLHSPIATGRRFDYCYAGQGLEHAVPLDIAAQIITVYSAEPRLGDTWVVGFADSHTALLTQDEFVLTIERSNAARRKSGLPPATFDLPWRVTTRP